MVVTTVVLAVPILAAAVVLVLTVEVVDDVFDTTVGSDDGIGFPSFVCSFKTCEEDQHIEKYTDDTIIRRQYQVTFS